MTSRQVRYYLDSENRFVVENYNWAKPFSNFFPGIAGKWGLPMWIYYVSKAQAICSIGVQDKDHAIMEFLSFNRACQIVGKEGFRTFIKLDGEPVYEPFQKVENETVTQRMVISSHELELHERNAELGLETTVVYFPLVNSPLSGLVRQVTIRNISRETREAEVLDGVPRVLPYGVSFEHVKVIARHIEGMMGIYDVEGVPLFRLKQTPADTAEVGELAGGNYYCSLREDGELLRRSIIVDPSVIFGETENHDFPWAFAHESIEAILEVQQVRESRTPCAFSALNCPIPPGGSLTLSSVIGHTPTEGTLEEFLAVLETHDGFLQEKRAENRNIIDQIKHTAFTVSGEPAFDQYCQQTFLDNVMRGGMPLTFNSTRGTSVFYTYVRQGGDLERDYHWFVLEPTYLSQGNGHYRNILQNRRMDTWFFPEVEDHNLVTFLNLTQTDGYNPLVVNGVTFTADDIGWMKAWLSDLVPGEAARVALLELVSRPFTPGEFIMTLEASGTRVERSYDEILADLLPLCRPNEIGALHVGYWIDHWLYNLDLIDTFLMIYPDRLRELLLEKKVYTFYDNPDVVQPRARKIVLVNGRVRQYGAVVRDPEKEEVIRSRAKDRCKVRTRFGSGEVYSTNLLGKLLCIVANKMASLDPEGIGVEMEADKPGWCDPLNGLPSLLGSSLCETLELQRACRLLLDSLSEIDLADAESVSLFEELYIFVEGLNTALQKRLDSVQKNRVWVFWDESHSLKEAFRATTRLGIHGKEREMTLGQVKGFLENCLRLLDNIFTDAPRGRLCHSTGVPYTYFINEVADYNQLFEDRENRNPLRGDSGHPLVEPREFKQTPVALFLEGPVHFLRVHRERARSIFESVKRSGIYDTKLHMYKCCESLETQPFEIGRIKAYARGWIENESVYTHMEYKWLLEILRSGLYEEFFEEIRNTLMPFLDPEMYGRSILENCSFLVSSAFPDAKLHGQAFQPRLSGVTCEMLHMWTIMVAGEHPFFLDADRQLRLRLQPVLPDWLFTKAKETYRYWDNKDGWTDVLVPENCFAFKFIGRTLVMYHNEERKATFGKDGAQVVAYTLRYGDGTVRTVSGDSLDASSATDVRDGQVGQMDVILG
ncbi:MAG: cellobiose phosphorylase [Anaerolineae bacterium]